MMKSMSRTSRTNKNKENKNSMRSIKTLIKKTLMTIVMTQIFEFQFKSINQVHIIKMTMKIGDSLSLFY